MKKLLLLLLVPLMSNAAPGAVTQYLMNEPATLLDVAMLRLDRLTHEFRERVGLSWTTDDGGKQLFRAEVNARYEPDDDKIYVSFSAMNSTPTPAQMEEGCTEAFFQMSIWLSKGWPQIFLHTGYVDPDQPPNMNDALREMIVLRCYFSSSRSSAEGRFWASKRLGDENMTIGRWPVGN